MPSNKTYVKITLNCSDSGQKSLYFVKDFDIFIVASANVPKAVVLNDQISVPENSFNVQVGTLAVINTLTQTEIKGVSIFKTTLIDQIIIILNPMFKTGFILRFTILKKYFMFFE